jgi:hypothetical protein
MPGISHIPDAGDSKRAGADSTPPAPVFDGTHAAEPFAGPEEHSGLIEIRDLARRTREHVIARASSEMRAQQSVLASAQPGALRDVVLVQPDGDRRHSVVPGLVRALLIAAVAAIVAVVAWRVLEQFAGRTPSAALSSHEDRGAPALPAGQPAPPAAALGAGAPAVPAPVLTPAAAAAEPPEVAAAELSRPTLPGPGAISKESGVLPAEARPNVNPPLASRPQPATGARAAARHGPKEAVGKATAAPAPAAPLPDESGRQEPAHRDLNDLIDQAAAAGGSPAAAAKKKPRLSRADIRAGMVAIRSQIAACHERFQVAGTVSVRVVIAADGAVTDARVSGPATATGSCVADAVRTAVFPAFDGPSMTVMYPFVLQ